MDRLEKRLRLGNPMPFHQLNTPEPEPAPTMKNCVQCGKPFDPDYQGDPEDVRCLGCIDAENVTKPLTVCPHCGGEKYDVIQIWEPNMDSPHAGYEGRLYAVATVTCAACGADYDIILTPAESRPIEEEGGNP